MSLQLDTIKKKAILGSEKVKGIVQGGAEKFKGLSKRNKIIVSAIAVLLVVLIILAFVLAPGKKAATISTAQVSRGNISVVISGTGTIKPIDEYQVTSLVKGEILTDTFNEGDFVEKGDLLYQIDSSDLENTLEKAQLSYEKSQLSYNQTMNELAKLNVKSTYNGTITNTYVKVGDSVGNGTKIADLVDMDTLLLSLPFNEGEADLIGVGNSAQVMLTSSFYSLSGTVTRVSNSSLISAEGARVKMVDIEVQNPGAIKPGDMATALVGEVACNGPGTFEYKLETAITAEASGEVVAMNFGKGDKVRAGSVVAVLDSSTAANTRANSQISLRDSQLSIENYNKQLEDYQITAPISGTVLKKTSKAGDTLDNSNASVVMAVIADMSTIIFEMNVDELDISKIKVGQRVSVTADAMEDRNYTGRVDYVSVVGTTQNGVTTYPIKIVVENPEDLIPGMNVSAEIVVESRENVLCVPVSAVNRGNIVYVKDNGKKSDDAVPTAAPQNEKSEKENATFQPGEYPQDAGSADAEPVVPESGVTAGEHPAGKSQSEKAEARPTMPSGGESAGGSPVEKGISARSAQTGEIPKAMQQNAPDGFKAVRVVTGLNDSNFIEIISGLFEGDEVYVSAQRSTGQSTMPMMGMGGMGSVPSGMGGMPGGMGGRMPGGR